MANSDKNIVITPNKGSSTDDPKIAFTGADSGSSNTITMRAYNTSNGTLSVEGSAGQLFSLTNQLNGTIFSVNDVSGMPAIEVYDNGRVKLSPTIPKSYVVSNPSSLAVNSDLYDTYIINSQAQNISISSDSGSPYDGQRLLFRFSYTAGSFTITWSTSNYGFQSIGVTLPYSVSSGKIIYVGCVYNATANKWDVIAVKSN